jgi:hypothetical protein
VLAIEAVTGNGGRIIKAANKNFLSVKVHFQKEIVNRRYKIGLSQNFALVF